jgi:photosystem II stability/assembly factor-like uncharacterized protein
MSRTKKWTLIGAGTALGLAACAPQVVDAYQDWKAERRKALVARTEEALARGADTIDWSQDFGIDGEEEEVADGMREEKDDALLRQLALQAEVGPRSPEFQARMLQIAAAEAQRWSAAGAEAQGRAAAGGADANAVTPTPPGTARWLSLGPSASRTSFNGSYYYTYNDTGRVTKLRVNRNDPRIVYMATAGGGVWRTANFGQFPSWTPITDGLGNLAAGALELIPGTPANPSTTPPTPAGPDTLWLGLGDAYDQQGGAILHSTDSGATWSTPVLLTADAHPADGRPVAVSNVREIVADPLDTQRLLVGTNDGLFRSVDNGATFTLVDLPNTAATGPVREAVWNIAYLGQAGGQSQWLVSGHYACPGGNPPNPTGGVQLRQLSFATCPGNAALGNYGDMWKSTDSGATWTSVRAAGRLPEGVTASVTSEFGRVHVAASDTSNPATTVVYALAASLYDTTLPPGVTFPGGTNYVMKSVDGGETWAVVARRSPTAGQTTLVTNPTTLSTNCRDINVGHGQSWYDLTLGVDPSNPNNVILGGDLCAVRSIDGGATWQNASHWLPQGGSGLTADGFLPYAHADWHTFTIARNGPTTMVLAGNDGGLYASYDVFERARPTDITWQNPTVGVVTHLMYSAGSGDPVFGDHRYAFSGLQDNGTRFRLLADDTFISDALAQNWDQVIGGDGIGTAVTRDPRGQNPTVWASVQNSFRYCSPRSRDCAKATRIEGGGEFSNYRTATAPAVTGIPVPSATNPAATTSDAPPFFVRYSAVNDENSSVAVATNYNLWRVRISPQTDAASFTRLTPNNLIVPNLLVNGSPVTSAVAIRGLGPYTSPHTYEVGGVPARLHGLPLGSGFSGVVVDRGGTGAVGDTTVVISANPLRVPGGTGPGGFHTLGFIQSIGLPKSPASLGGTDPSRTWLVGTAAASTEQGILVPDAVGHLFKTTDGGQTYVPFHGNGTGRDLPNVPVWVVRYDPSDATDSTLYVGTDIGLYRSTDGGDTWARYGVGLPQVRIYDLTVALNGSLLRVATYGRGMWEIHPHSEPGSVPANGDFDGNGVVDFLDLTALGTRLSQTPTPPTAAPAATPRYDASLDLSGSDTTLNDADLSALIGKFGGTP